MQVQEGPPGPEVSPPPAKGASRGRPAPASPSAGLDPVRVVEAALFSAGKPLALDEISENTQLPKATIQKALKALAEEYEERGTSLEIGQAGSGKWAMQVRAAYAPATQRLAPMEIAVKLLKTLALIAYHQPVLQSQLIEMVGDKGYEHIRELRERGLVKKRVHERSFMLMTTERFPEYFGIPASEREEIKVFLANKLGIAVPKTDGRGNAKLGAFKGTESAEAPAEASDDAPSGDPPEGPTGADESSSPDSPSEEPRPEP